VRAEVVLVVRPKGRFVCAHRDEAARCTTQDVVDRVATPAAGLKSNTVQLSNEPAILKGRGFQPRRLGVLHGL